MSLKWIEDLGSWEGKLAEAKAKKFPPRAKSAIPTFPDGKNHVFSYH